MQLNTSMTQTDLLMLLEGAKALRLCWRQIKMGTMEIRNGKDKTSSHANDPGRKGASNISGGNEHDANSHTCHGKCVAPRYEICLGKMVDGQKKILHTLKIGNLATANKFKEVFEAEWPIAFVRERRIRA